MFQKGCKYNLEKCYFLPGKKLGVFSPSCTRTMSISNTHGLLIATCHVQAFPAGGFYLLYSTISCRWIQPVMFYHFLQVGSTCHVLPFPAGLVIFIFRVYYM